MAQNISLEISDPSVLDNLFVCQSYIAGYEPSNIDVLLHDNIKSGSLLGNLNNYVNVQRWYKHIGSFTKCEMNLCQQLNLNELKIDGILLSSASSSSSHSNNAKNIINTKSKSGGGREKEEVRSFQYIYICIDIRQLFIIIYYLYQLKFF